jgi:hypothetical protein
LAGFWNFARLDPRKPPEVVAKIAVSADFLSIFAPLDAALATRALA